MEGREAIENFCRQYNYKFYKVFSVSIFATLKNTPVFIGKGDMVFKENYGVGGVQIDCLDDSFQAKKIGSSWNTKYHDITFDNSNLIITDEVKEVKIIIGN